MARRWSILVAVGIVCVLLSGPVASLEIYACAIFLGFVCGNPDFLHPLDRVIGWVVMVLGWYLIARGLAESRSPHEARDRRPARTLRWLLVPVSVTALILLAFVHPRALETRLVVDVVGIPPAARSRVHAVPAWTPASASVYRRSFDHLLGLPFSEPGADADGESTQAHSEFRVVSSRPSFENWRASAIDVRADVGRKDPSTVVSVELVPCDDCGETTIQANQRNLEPCAGYLGKDIRCYVHRAHYPRGATLIALVIDLREIVGSDRR